MAPPGINLITTVASRLYALAPAPPSGLRFHSAPLPSPADSTPRPAEYPFDQQPAVTSTLKAEDGTAGRPSGPIEGTRRPMPTWAATGSTSSPANGGVGSNPWDDDGGDVSSEGTARQRSTERSSAGADALGQGGVVPAFAENAATGCETGARWRRQGGSSNHSSRASSFRSVQDGLTKAEHEAEERDEVRELELDHTRDHDGCRSDDSGESDDDCVVLVQSQSLSSPE